MKLTDLPSPYRELAEMRHEKTPLSGNEAMESFAKHNQIGDAFLWNETMEGFLFWGQVNNGETPPIPQSSLDELSEWQKREEPKKDTVKIVKITDASRDSFWYAELIGECFYVVDYDETMYKVIQDPEHTNDYIDIADCMVVPVYEHTAIVEAPDHRLFTAAVAAMQGILANRELQLALYADHKLNGTTRENAIAFCAVKEAQALLAELDKTK